MQDFRPTLIFPGTKNRGSRGLTVYKITKDFPLTSTADSHNSADFIIQIIHLLVTQK